MPSAVNNDSAQPTRALSGVERHNAAGSTRLTISGLSTKTDKERMSLVYLRINGLNHFGKPIDRNRSPPSGKVLRA